MSGARPCPKRTEEKDAHCLASFFGFPDIGQGARANGLNRCGSAAAEGSEHKQHGNADAQCRDARENKEEGEREDVNRPSAVLFRESGPNQ